MRRLTLVLALMVLVPVGWLQVAPAATGPAGSHQAFGDFNGDGVDDIAIGAPQDDDSGVDDSGSLNLIYGSPAGLSDIDDQQFVQGANLQDPAEIGDAFGGAVTAGDFNGDGFDDLAVSAPAEDLATVGLAGAVHVLFGSMVGLTADDDQFLTAGTGGLPGEPAESAFFGVSLGGGDINRDGRDDLVIGAGGDATNGVQGGSVTVVYGGASGLDLTTGQRFHQASPGVADAPGSEEVFGASVTLGNFGRGRGLDLAIGVPGEGIGGDRGGAVAVLYAKRGRIRTAGDQLWHQNRPGMASRVRDGDTFGLAVGAGNMEGPPLAELAIGVPGEGIAGAVQVLIGRSGGLTAANSQLWSQRTRGIAGQPDSEDAFGFSVAVGNLGRSRYGDLAVGVPGDTVGSLLAGAVNVIYGGRRGLSATGDQIWHQGKVPGDTPEDVDRFGSQIGIANFGSGGRDDLAIGVTGEDSTAGRVLVLYGGQSGLADDGAQYWDQGTPGIVGTPEADDLFGFFGPCIPVGA